MAYSEPPERNMVRLIVTSAYSIGSAPSALSMVSSTSARPSGGRPDVPAKMTSSILPPRRLLAPCSPITQARASTTLDLPEPLGPTMQVMPGSSCSVVDDAKDLNPLRVRLFRYNVAPHGDGSRPSLRSTGCVGRTAGASGDERGKCSVAHPTQGHPRSRAPGRVGPGRVERASSERGGESGRLDVSAVGREAVARGRGGRVARRSRSRRTRGGRAPGGRSPCRGR